MDGEIVPIETGTFSFYIQPEADAPLAQIGISKIGVDMDISYIKKLIKLLDESGVDEIEIEEEGKKVRVSKAHHNSSFYRLLFHNLFRSLRRLRNLQRAESRSAPCRGGDPFPKS